MLSVFMMAQPKIPSPPREKRTQSFGGGCWCCENLGVEACCNRCASAPIDAVLPVLAFTGLALEVFIYKKRSHGTFK